MLTLSISVNGKTREDLELALEEAVRRFWAGNKLGFDRSDSGNFRFEVTGDEEPADNDEEGNDEQE